MKLVPVRSLADAVFCYNDQYRIQVGSNLTCLFTVAAARHSQSTMKTQNKARHRNFG